MTWVFLGLIAGLAAGMAGFAITAIRATSDSRDDRVATVKVTGQLERMTDAHGTAVRDLGVEAAGRVADGQRYEKAIAGLKAEVARLEGELDADLSPTAVRDRLAGSGLLGSPETGTTAVQGPVAAAALPASVAAVLGAVGGGPGRAG